MSLAVRGIFHILSLKAVANLRLDLTSLLYDSQSSLFRFNSMLTIHMNTYLVKRAVSYDICDIGGPSIEILLDNLSLELKIRIKSFYLIWR